MLSWFGLIGLVCAGFLMERGDEATAARYAPKPVTFAELIKELRGLHGKVIVVDLWTDGCGICKIEFPNLVRLHRKYAKDGLTSVSLNLDDPDDAVTLKQVNAFLAEQKVDFPSYLLKEDLDTWQRKFDISGPPAVFVFGRDGRQVRKWTEPNYKEIEALVVELLKAP